MEIFQVLREDHGNLLHLLDRLENTSGEKGQQRLMLLKDLRVELISHAKAEEEAFLKHLKSNRSVAEFAQEASEELRWLTQLLGELETVDAASPQWESKFRILRETLEEHIDADEKRMFPEIEPKLSSAVSDQMAQDFDEVKDEVLKQSRPQ